MFKLPDLPYDFKALEPYIDARTMEIHHDKHHGGYVKKLNGALESIGGSFGDWTIEKILANVREMPEKVRTAVRNNGGGHYNHSLFWEIMTPDGGGKPTGDFLKTLEKSFGSFEDFREKFTKAATTRFGSGWAWLYVDKKKKLVIDSAPNQDNPIIEGTGTPILGLDVWEHAYYLKYQNRRPDYIKQWFNTINWEEVAKRYEKLTK